MIKSFLILISLTLILFSCSKKEEQKLNPDIGSGYAGLEVGKWVVYNVDSITYDDFDNSIDTASYQIRELVDSKFLDLGDDEAFKIIRYRRDSDTLAWDIIDVWSSKLTATSFQKTEENIKYLKLILPVKESKTWNGNSMNNQSSILYEFDFVDQSKIIGGISLGNVLRVIQGGEDGLDNLINPTFFEEKYAKGIGLVYKRSTDKVRSALNSPWKGYDVIMTLSSSGG
tara:strand:- start:3213 stop:3896 length:684 start_codon:yes stop_codon:yes gene_type:complete